jgi:hypothetical protein
LPALGWQTWPEMRHSVKHRRAADVSKGDELPVNIFIPPTAITACSKSTMPAMSTGCGKYAGTPQLL